MTTKSLPLPLIFQNGTGQYGRDTLMTLSPAREAERSGS
jgi:hypothetical protein